MSSRATWPWKLAITSGVLFAVIYVRFLQRDYASYASQRNRAAVAIAISPPSTPEAEPIEIAVVWPYKHDSFIRGVHLAEATINKTMCDKTTIDKEGGVRQRGADGREYFRKLKVRYFDERSGESESNYQQSTKAGTTIARQIARDTKIAAVIGHSDESIMPASVVYQNSGVLFIAPTNMDQRVTLHGFERVFRTSPRYQQVAQAMADAITQVLGKKHIRLAVLYPSEMGMKPEDISQRLTRHANTTIESFDYNVNFDVIFATEYHRGQTDYRKVIAPFLEWEQQYDVILIMDGLPDAENLRRQLEDGFAHKKLDLVPEKLTLDLTSLEGSDNQAQNADLQNADFSTGTDLAFDQAVSVVLRGTKQGVVILASRDSYGASLGAQIRKSIGEASDDPNRPLRLEMYRTYQDQSIKSYLELVAEVLQKKPDFVFVAGTGESAVNLIRQLREAALDRPIICSPDLEFLLIADASIDPVVEPVHSIIDDWLKVQQRSTDQNLTPGGKPPENAAQMFARLRDEHGYQGSEAAVRGYVAERKGGTYVASVFDAESLRLKVRAFVDDFQRKYSFNDVDALAAQGFQAINLLKEAFERGGSTNPETAAAALRLFIDDEGIFGRNRFSENGDLLGLEIVFKRRGPDGVNLIRLNTAAPRQLIR